MSETSARELRTIFGKNLRELAASQKSITHVCNQIGINRTQFNRYLNGESFPRPDVLHKICAFFNVDARVLTERLEDLRAKREASMSSLLVDMSKILSPEKLISEKAKLRPGFYIFWRNSFFYEDNMTCELLQLSPMTGGFDVSGRVYIGQPESDESNSDQSIHWHDKASEANGYMLEELNGYLYMLSAPEVGYPAIIGFVAQHALNATLYTGYSALAADRHYERKRIVSCLFERIEGGYSEISNARKRMGIFPADRVPTHIRKALKPDAPVS